MVSVVMCILEPVTTTTPQQSYIQTVVFFTCDGAIGEDATAVFNMLSGYSEPLSWNELCGCTDLASHEVHKADPP